MTMIDLLAHIELMSLQRDEEIGYFYAVPSDLMGEIKARLRELARASE